MSSSSSGGLFGGDYSTISIGDRGSRVKAMQQALITLKYLSGKADGIFGQQTLKAVYTFQSRSGLKQDGLAGKKTLAALESAVISGSTAAFLPAGTAWSLVNVSGAPLNIPAAGRAPAAFAAALTVIRTDSRSDAPRPF